MNIDLNIVNRAFNKAGEEALTEKEIEENQNRWKLIKNFYLSTILETLSNTSWTSMTVRSFLDPIEEDDSGLFVYSLPIDCAKPIELVSKCDYTVENNTLYTSDQNPCLIYVTNNYTGEYKYEEVAVTEETPEGEIKKLYTKDEETGVYSLATEYIADTVYYRRLEEDYPLYNDFKFDPLLSEYIETKLASKIVLKLSGNQNLYQLLYSEAVRMENTAVKATFAHAHNKDKGNPYWGDVLGLPRYGEEY